MFFEILFCFFCAGIVGGIVYFAYHYKLQLERNGNNEIDPELVKFNRRNLIREELEQKEKTVD